MNTDKIDADWGMEERFRYKSLHRAADIEILHDLWSKVVSPSYNAIPLAEAPRNVQKKYNRVVKSHTSYWMDLSNQQVALFQELDEAHSRMVRVGMVVDLASPLPTQEINDKIIEIAEKAKDSMLKLIPKVNGRIVVDITEANRGTKGLWSAQDRKGCTILLFWIIYRGMTIKRQLRRDNACLRDIDFLSSLFPPLSQNYPLPHPYEVVALRFKVSTHLADYAGKYLRDPGHVFDVARCCGAAGRLIMYHKDNYEPNELKLLEEKLRIVPQAFVRSIVAKKLGGVLKMDNLPPRPCFTEHELNDMEKEWGLGVYCPSQFVCSGCGKDRSQVRLSLCAGCHRKWYCSRECQTSDWKTTGGNHKEICEQEWRSKPILVSAAVWEQCKDIRSCDVRARRIVTPDGTDIYIVPLQGDGETMFDALTDRPIVCDEAV
ncbi:MAG: hypothetical protein SGILL_007356 [Bacillariaceae sp.]